MPIALCKYCHLRPPSRKRGNYCSKACSNASRARPLADRFLDFYKPGKPELCWPWQGTRDRNGYGVITTDDRRQLRAHRVAYERVQGQIPTNGLVCHRCDNPSCVNPAHLWLGSATDNSNDKVTKKRHSFGTTHGCAKLNEQDVRDIRRLYPQMSQQAIANQYGIHQTIVSDIVRHVIWKHVKA